VARGFAAVFCLIVLSTSGSGSAAQNASTRDIYSIAADGTDQRNLTNTPGVSEDLLSRSPDGTKLAFVQDGWLVVSAADGQGPRRVASFSRDDNFADPPAWSPSGSELAYTQGFSCTGALCSSTELWVADVGSAHARRLLRKAAQPTWSPDGRRLAFTRARLTTNSSAPGYRLSVVVARPDGSRLHTIARGGSGTAWSPTGRLVAFSGIQGLIRSRPDGSRKRTLTKRPRQHIANWISDVGNIAWSPDGRRLAFTGFTLKAGDAVYVIRADGLGLLRLGPGSLYTPVSWSPDGKTLVWPHPLRHALIVASTGGRGKQEISVDTSGGPTTAIWSGDGARIFFAG
jgi:Tol biopolymer transport system component